MQGPTDLYLKSLTLRGFKSFASTTTLNFEPGITAIVGPNGSGKSNVVDALAWVMGEQGAQSLRGGKMEDVIFAGTAGRAPLGRAEVSLTIDNTDRVLPIEYTEVTISRTLFRNGGSEYAINAQQCRLLDVQELLSDTGMGREMHVIVGQGQLDQILRASPESRRGFIEEAAGVLKHRRRKEKAIRKLASTQANLARLTDLLAEIRRQLKPLGRQATVARRAATVQAELRDARCRLLADELSQTRLALESDNAANQARQARRRQTEAELAQARDAERAAEFALQELAPRSAIAQENWYALASLAERITATASIAAERMRHGDEPLPTGDGRDPEAMAQEAARIRAEEAGLADQVTRAEEALQAASSARDLAEAAEQVAARAHAERLRAVADRREELARLGGQVNSLRSRLQAGGEEEARLAARQAEALTRAKAAELEFVTLETQLAGIAEGEPGLDDAYEHAAADRERAESALAELREAERAARQQQVTLQARLDALQIGLQRRDASGALLGSAGPVPLLGSLSELVTVEPGWQAAVSAALGVAAEALVVADLGDALAAFEYLKAKDLGRAGLLIADAPSPGDELPALPAGARWAIDALTCPVELRAGLWRLLRSVVLVADPATARALVSGAPGLMAVTADGDVVSRWFAAGGSGAQPSVIEIQAAIDATRAAVGEIQQDLERLRLRMSVAQRRLAETRRASEIALERLHDSDARLAALTAELSTLAQTGRAARAEAERLGQAIVQAGANRAVDEQRLTELTERLERAGAEEAAEPDPAERDRLAAAARASRSVETDARLALRTAEERVRSLAGRADSLSRAAAHERQAQARARARAKQLRREAAVARAVHTAAGWLAGRVTQARAAAAAERRAADEARQRAEAELGHRRAESRALAQALETIVENTHRDELARIELTMRLEQYTEQAMDELALDPDTLLAEYGPDQPVPVLTRPDGSALGPDDEPVAPVPYDRAGQEARLRSAQRNLAALGRVNPLALEEFEAMNERHAFLAGQLADLKKTRKDLLDIIGEVDARVQEVFAAAYGDVAACFSEVFERLFPGGAGQLVLTTPDDMLTTGIEIEARPAGKRVRRLSLLSGGERSLVAVAFLISLFIARPSPFYILDEVEAALDDVNLGRLLGIYEELRRSSQLLVITHHKRTMEVADALYGVTMRDDGVSTVISQRLHG